MGDVKLGWDVTEKRLLLAIILIKSLIKRIINLKLKPCFASKYEALTRALADVGSQQEVLNVVGDSSAGKQS